MSATLPGLTIPITGDISKLQSSFTKAAASAKKFATAVEGPLNKMRAGLNSAGNMAMKFVAPVAAAAGAVVSFQAVMGAFERADNLGKMANALGIAVDKLSQLHYVASLNQGSAEGMNTALKNMERLLGEAANGGGEAANTLKSLGLEVKDFVGLKPEEAFGKFSDALNGTTDQGAKMSLMMKVFGRSAQEVAGSVKLGSAGIAEMGKEGEKLGRTLTADKFGALAAGRQAMEEMGAAIEGVTNSLSVALAPVISWVVEGFNKWIDSAGGFQAAFSKVADYVVVGIGVIKTAWLGLQLMWEGAKIVIGTVSSLFYKLAHNAVWAFKWIGNVGEKTWDWLGDTFATFKDAVVAGWFWISDKVIGIISGIGEAFGEQMRDMGLAMTRSGVKGMIEAGDALAGAGAELIVGSVKLKQGSAELLKGAQDSLDQSVEALEKSKASLVEAITSPNITTGLEDSVYQANAFREEAIKSFEDIVAAAQAAGSPIAEAMASYAQHMVEFSQKAQVAAAEGANGVAVISADAAAKMEAQTAAHFGVEAKSWEDHWIDLLERKQAALEEMDLLTTDNQTIQQARQEAFNAEQEVEEQKHIDAQVQLWNSGAMGKMAAIGGILNNLASLMQSKNKALFQIGKVAALSQNVIDTIQSAASSYKFGSDIGGPIVGAAFAATAVAAGMVRAQQLMSTQFGGGGSSMGGGGGSASSTSAAEAASTAAQKSESRNMNVTLYGDSFNATQVRGLISAINDQAGDNMTIKIQGGGK